MGVWNAVSASQELQYTGARQGKEIKTVGEQGFSSITFNLRLEHNFPERVVEEDSILRLIAVVVLPKSPVPVQDFLLRKALR